MATSDSSLPLHCSICPKKPNFSDVSHLLTHVASKGHLSHYYKVKVRASSDLVARSTIDAYDAWYDQWNVEQLMSERMQQKDSKRSKARAQLSKSRSSKKSTKTLNEFVDPCFRVNGKVSVKKEGQVSDSDLEALLNSPPPKRPKLHLWDTMRPGSYDATPIESSSPSVMTVSGVSIETSLSRADTGEGKADFTVDEATKLKGAIWPGMDIFDSATADMKRKRNQKKHESVLDQLEQNSLGVEPTEVIYFPFGALKKSRPISGRVESSSPTIDEVPPPPRRRSGIRRPLADKDVNGSKVAPRGSGQLMRPATRSTKIKAKFPVLRDIDYGLDQQSGMPTLTSAFQPLSTGADLTTAPGYAPAETTSYMPADVSTFSNQSMFFPQPQYGPANMNFYGPYGYDLAAFLAHYLPQMPINQARVQQDPESALDNKTLPLDHTQVDADFSDGVRHQSHIYDEIDQTPTSLDDTDDGIEEDYHPPTKEENETEMFAETRLDGHPDEFILPSDFDEDIERPSQLV